jgi:hypothetical protein
VKQIDEGRDVLISIVVLIEEYAMCCADV